VSEDQTCFPGVPELIEGCFSLLESLEVQGSLSGKEFLFCRPALTKYGPYQWLWDSGWHIIVRSLRQPEKAAAELRSLLQFQQPNGFIPEIIFWKQPPMLKTLYRLVSGYSRAEFTDLTQMPMLAYSVRAIWQKTKNTDLLREFVPPIIRYMEWWETRDHDADGLVSIIHPWESGMDASPLYDPALGLKRAAYSGFYFRLWNLLCKYRGLGWDQQAILKQEYFNVEDAGLCSVYADNWGVLASLADEFDREKAAFCRAKHTRYQQAIIQKCWNTKSERFISFFHKGGKEQPVKGETVQALLPLLLDELPENIQSKLLQKIKDPAAFNLPYPFPSVAGYEPAFNPGESGLLWRGPLWPATNWLVMEGLLKHGYTSEAGNILRRWTDLYLKNGTWEYYNPLTGKGLGQKGLGMSTILADMLFRTRDTGTQPHL